MVLKCVQSNLLHPAQVVELCLYNVIAAHCSYISLLSSYVTTQLPQTSKQRKGHRRLPLREVQEDEPTILRSWIFFFSGRMAQHDARLYRD